MGGGGTVKGWVWPHGPNQPLTQPSVSVIYMCMFIYFNSRGLFSSKQCTVIEEIAEMKG
jgi:hypothetical protein